jgi:membrane-associated phospholipid phosphatase
MQLIIWLNIRQTIIEWDRDLFIKLNSEWTNPLFDAVLPWLRNSAVWAPLYLFVLFFVVLNFKNRSGWWILLFITTVALTDMTGTYVFKHNFERIRPCYDPDMYMYVRRLLDNCSGGYSFISNHAANHFGMATFFYISFRKIIPKWAWLGFLWAGSIAYAQVYVGVHYPTDVFCGALLGIFSGLFTGYIFNKRFGFAIFDNQPIVSS